MTAQLPISKEQLLADIAHAEEKAATLCGPCADDHARLAGYLRALLAAHEQEPVGTLFVKKTTYSDREIGNHFAFMHADCAMKMSAGQYPLYTHPAPVPAVPDDWKGQLTCTHCTPKSVSQVSTGTSVGVAPVPAVPDFDTWFKREFHPDKTGPYVKDQMRFCWNACRAAMLNGGKS